MSHPSNIDLNAAYDIVALGCGRQLPDGIFAHHGVTLRVMELLDAYASRQSLTIAESLREYARDQLMDAMGDYYGYTEKTPEKIPEMRTCTRIIDEYIQQHRPILIPPSVPSAQVKEVKSQGRIKDSIKLAYERLQEAFVADPELHQAMEDPVVHAAVTDLLKNYIELQIDPNQNRFQTTIDSLNTSALQLYFIEQGSDRDQGDCTMQILNYIDANFNDLLEPTTPQHYASLRLYNQRMEAAERARNNDIIALN